MGSSSRPKFFLPLLGCVVAIALCSVLLDAQQIPDVAWSRGIGEPLENPGVTKVKGNLDEGYWQGVPLGGFGSGSIGRTYRGDFARWHLKVGVHKYFSVPSNGFAAFQQPEGGQPTAAVLRVGKPDYEGILSSWNWNYPVGAGKYHALFPKAWFDYQYDSFPVRLVCEQFSPGLPNNYKETSFPVGVFIRHAKNTADKPVKVSILFSWTNMVGWFGEFDRQLSPWLGSGNFNKAQQMKLPNGKTMKGVVFDRVRSGAAQADSDGQFVIAALEDQDVKVSYQTAFAVASDGSSVWKTFSQDGTLRESEHNWLSSGGNPIAGAIAVTFSVAPGATKDVPTVLAWDFPITQFGNGRRWYKRYTAFWGTTGSAA